MENSKGRIWQASGSRWQASQLSRFVQSLEQKLGLSFENYWDLHRFSCENLELFWQELASFTGIRWSQSAKENWAAAPQGEELSGRFFPGATLSFTDNLLPIHEHDSQQIISIIEGLAAAKVYTKAEIRCLVAQATAGLQALGVQKGDRVAAVCPNTVEALVIFLASAAVGAIYCSTSPDFGFAGIYDRIGQLQPKVLFATRGYQYAGKWIDTLAIIKELQAKLPNLLATVVIDPLQKGFEGIDAKAFEEFVAACPASLALQRFAPIATEFEHPLMILFSSGTTGKPKCIIHSVGGTLLQHKKELMLHADLGPGKRLLYYTTCGWMMWNWMSSALSTGADLVLFEGAVNRDEFRVLWQAVAEHQVTHFGTSPKFLAASAKAGRIPGQDFTLGHLETILSTGSPLMPEQYQWIYEAVKSDVHVNSISGGTDIVSCFMLGNLWLPVYPGEIQAPGLAMAVEAWDEAGQSKSGVKAELVCTKVFPSMPLGFWGDKDQKKYREAYFQAYPGHRVWRHGDFIEVTQHRGIIVHGRSDATLNPGGVRIGTAEIYDQVESLPAIVDSLAVSRDHAGDAEMVLFVKLQAGSVLDQDLRLAIQKKLRENLTPRHVPAAIYAVTDIPYTRSGKKLEIAVTRILQSRALDNLNAIANPECLKEYEAFRL